MKFNINSIGIIGSGSWGTALSIVLSESIDNVLIWGRNTQTVNEINVHHSNNYYLPNIELAKNIKATNNIEDLNELDILLLCIPSSITKDVLNYYLQNKHNLKKQIIVSCTKGISSTGERISQMIQQTSKFFIPAVLSGPSHAEEVALKKPTALSLATLNENISIELQNLLTSSWFRVYTTDDIIGLELSGSMKNIFAIASGVCKGLNLGNNSQAALITRGLAEMNRIGLKLGAKEKTFMGLGGIGDLIVTCFSSLSRNFRFGNLIGQGISPENAIKEIKMVVEGYKNTKSFYDLKNKLDIKAPLIDEIYNVLYKQKRPQESLQSLFARKPTSEF